MKSGTTWMQMIVGLLIFQTVPLPAALDTLSPWIERRVMDPETLKSLIDQQAHRRFLKSHMPFDALPEMPTQKIIFVARDPRDMALSLWDHNRKFRPEVIDKMNDFPGRVGPPMPPTPEAFPVFFREWLTRGWFDWESDGYPLISLFRSVATWWAERDRPNILMVHFNDLSRDLGGEMRRVAEFLSIEVARARWPRLIDAAGFAAMKQNADALVPFMGSLFVGGAGDFINHGAAGRWTGVLSDTDLSLYREILAARLPAACAHWLETGRRGSHIS